MKRFVNCNFCFIDVFNKIFTNTGLQPFYFPSAYPTSLSGLLFAPTGLSVKMHKKTARKRSKHVAAL